MSELSDERVAAIAEQVRTIGLSGHVASRIRLTELEAFGRHSNGQCMLWITVEYAGELPTRSGLQATESFIAFHDEPANDAQIRDTVADRIVKAFFNHLRFGHIVEAVVRNAIQGGPTDFFVPD